MEHKELQRMYFPEMMSQVTEHYLTGEAMQP